MEDKNNMLMECRACGELISKNAKSCPCCGEPYTSNSGMAIIVFMHCFACASFLAYAFIANKKTFILYAFLYVWASLAITVGVIKAIRGE